MPLEDHLLPGEEVQFRSTTRVKYGGKDYEVVVTNKRLILYARRGLVFKSDDVITQKLDEIQTIKYKEKGIIGKKGIVEVHGKTIMRLEGPASEMKPLYQRLLGFL